METYNDSKMVETLVDVWTLIGGVVKSNRRLCWSVQHGGKKYEAEEREEERRRKRIRSVPNDIRILKNELLHEKAVKKSTLYEYGNFWRSPDEKKKLRQKLE